MFFLISKIFGYFVLPFTIALLLLLRFWWVSRRREKPRWGVFWAGLIILWFFATPWGANLVLLPLEGPYQHLPPPAQADVIVVMGGAIDLLNTEGGRIEYTQASDRFMHAVHLAKRFPEATLIFAGGTINMLDKDKTEASILKAEAVALGIDPARIRVDDRSRNTHENALETRRIMQETGGRAVVAVTSAFHMKRSLACLRKVGIEATPFPVDFRGHFGKPDLFGFVPQATVLGDATGAVREYVGLVVYRLKGYI